MAEITVIGKIIFFLTVAAFISLMLPVQAQFISVGNLAVFGASTAITAGICVVTTGIPCAIALGVSGLSTVLGSLLTGLDLADVPIFEQLVNTSPYSWIGTLILTPISIILTLYIAHVARGKG